MGQSQSSTCGKKGTFSDDYALPSDREGYFSGTHRSTASGTPRVVRAGVSPECVERATMADPINGTEGNDTFVGNDTTADNYNGLGGDDQIFGQGGNDIL